jgi:hypothetical protein
MKKILLLAVAVLLFSVQGFSQFGIKAGLNFNTMGDINLGNIEKGTMDNKTGFHVGALYNFKIPLTGISVQPELVYTQTESTLETKSPATDCDFTLKQLQFAAGLQWGIDLIMLRPYLQVAPYIGYVMGNKSSLKDIKWEMDEFRYGLGLGAGLDVWKLQVSGKYVWDLGKASEFDSSAVGIGTGLLKGKKDKGFQLSIAYMF